MMYGIYIYIIDLDLDCIHIRHIYVLALPPLGMIMVSPLFISLDLWWLWMGVIAG